MNLASYTPSRWELMSALQKSIRRGRHDVANRAASLLHHHDRRTLVSRLRVIAVEDIGCGNLPLVHQVLTTVGRAKEQVLLELVGQMCGSIKDRSACDLAGALHTSIPHDDSLKRRAVKIMAEHATHPPHPLAMEVAAIGLRSTRLDLCHAIPAISAMAGEAKAWRSDDIPGLPDIHGWPSATWDMYVREGKAAYRLFVNRHPEVREQLERMAPRKVLDLIGYAVFAVESECLDKRLAYSGSDVIHRLGNAADIMQHGVPACSVTAVMQVIASHLPAIHDARVTAAKGR